MKSYDPDTELDLLDVERHVDSCCKQVQDLQSDLNRLQAQVTVYLFLMVVLSVCALRSVF